jgi:hypothetical protein
MLQLGLCDEKPVEGVCVMKRKAAGGPEVERGRTTFLKIALGFRARRL